MVMARQQWLHSWNIDAQRGRHDYDCDDHLIKEMENASYFGAIYQCFRRGDYIYVTDAAQEMIVFVVDDVDAPNRKVWCSVLERLETRPLTAETGTIDSGYTIKWRGPRGGLWCIVNKDGEVQEGEYKNKEEATRALQAFLLKKSEAAA